MKTQGVAQFGSVSVLGTGGRRFKSCHLDNFSFFHFLSASPFGHYHRVRTDNNLKFYLPLFEFKKNLSFSALLIALMGNDCSYC